MQTYCDFIPRPEGYDAFWSAHLLVYLGFCSDAVNEEFTAFWRKKVPKHPSLEDGITAVKLRKIFRAPIAAYTKYVSTLNDEDLNSLIEKACNTLSACRVSTDAEKLIRFNNVLSLIVALPHERVSPDVYTLAGLASSSIRLNPDLDVYETSRQLGYFCTRYHYREEGCHKLLFDPYGYESMTKEESDAIIDEDGEELKKMIQARSGWFDGYVQANREVAGEPTVSKDADGYTCIKTRTYVIKVKQLEDGKFSVHARYMGDAVACCSSDATVMIRQKNHWAPMIPAGNAGLYELAFPKFYNGSLTIWIRTTGQHIDVDL